MNKIKAMKLIGVYECSDTALPQGWLNDIADRMIGDKHENYQSILCSICWTYDEDNNCFGRPCALSVEGNEILKRINHITGSKWPLTPIPADRTWEGMQQVAKDIGALWITGETEKAKKEFKKVAEDNAMALAYMTAHLVDFLHDNGLKEDATKFIYDFLFEQVNP